MPLAQPLTKFTTASEAVVTYGYTDIADGTNVQTFFAAPVRDSTGADFILTTETTPGANIAPSQVARLQGNESEKDFDLTAFNTPRTVKGTAVFSGTLYSDGTNATVKAQLKKWDGTTETDVSSQITSPTSTSNTEQVLMRIPMTETHFSEGDVLRLSIDFNGTNQSQGFGVDPSGATQGAASQSLNPCKVSVPFKLEV